MYSTFHRQWEMHLIKFLRCQKNKRQNMRVREGWESVQMMEMYIYRTYEIPVTFKCHSSINSGYYIIHSPYKESRAKETSLSVRLLLYLVDQADCGKKLASTLYLTFYLTYRSVFPSTRRDEWNRNYLVLSWFLGIKSCNSNGLRWVLVKSYQNLIIKINLTVLADNESGRWWRAAF